MKYALLVHQSQESFDRRDSPAGMAAGRAYGEALQAAGVLIGGALIGALIFLEWRSDRWTRYRRAAFGIGVFALNSAILILISFLVAYAVIAAAQVSHPARQILFP